jgi:hypothetical protein
MIWAAAAVCSGGAVLAGAPGGASASGGAVLAGAPGGASAAPGVTAAAQPAPAFARTVVLAPVGGKVLVELPGRYHRFVRLTAPKAVPLGTAVDTSAGTVRLTSALPGAAPVAAKTQSGRFFRGIFTVEQSRTAGGLVDLVIRDNLPRAGCQPGSTAHPAALSQRVLGLLRGVAKGRFRTTGRFAAATVRGTDWGVRDRCDGTLTVVRRGVVVVRDFRLQKNVIVRAGQTYLAKAR